MTTSKDPYPRDLVGYGANPPDPKWPGGARVALNIALNYEAGGELSVLHGDETSESLMTDFGLPPVKGARSMLSESAFEYGSRRGVWRLLRMFDERDIKISVFAVVAGLLRNPEVGRAMVEAGHEMVSHGWRWIDYQYVPEDEEREHIRLAVEGITRVAGRRPVGCMTGRMAGGATMLNDPAHVFEGDRLARRGACARYDESRDTRQQQRGDDQG